MPGTFRLCYITDRQRLPSAPLELRVQEAIRAGVDLVQIREKDLPARELELLARDAARTVRETRNAERETRLLINSRSDVALATGADGVHLPSDDIPASDARAVWLSRNVIIAVSCHTAEEVRLAEAEGADFAVFGPVFEKVGTSLSVGLDALHGACLGPMPVLAIGGVTLDNARACVAAGAAGVAAIRLFQENDIASVVKKLRKAAG